MFAKILIATYLVLPQSAHALIEKSAYEPAHQTAIESAVFRSCGLSGRIILLKSLSTVAEVREGVTDYVYRSELEVLVGVDQYESDRYVLTVQSQYRAEFGVYAVTSVTSPNVTCR